MGAAQADVTAAAQKGFDALVQLVKSKRVKTKGERRRLGG